MAWYYGTSYGSDEPAYFYQSLRQLLTWNMVLVNYVSIAKEIVCYKIWDFLKIIMNKYECLTSNDNIWKKYIQSMFIGMYK